MIAVQVPPGLPHIYSLHGLYLTRTGDNNRPLTTPELRRLLLERGVDTGARDDTYDATAAGWAENAGHADIVAML